LGGTLNRELLTPDGCEEKIVSYITHVLQPGETIRYQGSVRWILYLQALLLALVGAVASLLGPPWGWAASAICFLLALIPALRAWFIRWTNEIVVTDRRVIYAHGFIQRHTVEVHMDKIESVDVDQTVMGRILDYGDVTIRGTGTTLEPIREVDRPIAFRNEVTAR
jgi:uncharacterized membrane protein YdbT with pleckstrin-like domain